jgi:inward rectifier potassium channel
MRRNHVLELERSTMPIFVLAWTLIHRLDEKSPLHGLTLENAPDKVVGIVASFTGVDETMLQAVHARNMYTAQDLRFGARFADMIDNSVPGMLIIDHEKMDVLHAEDPASGK